MKQFLHSGCLLRSVFEVELKMSSFLYQRNVPRGKIVIQIGSKGRKKRKEGGWEQTDRIQAVLSAPVLHIIQDREMQVDSSATFIFSWCDLKNLLNRSEQGA